MLGKIQARTKASSPMRRTGIEGAPTNGRASVGMMRHPEQIVLYDCGERDSVAIIRQREEPRPSSTRLLQSGMDLRTAMRFSGRSDLGSVMRYLSPASDATLKAHIDGMKWM